jgi:hypothetical protein
MHNEEISRSVAIGWIDMFASSVNIFSMPYLYNPNCKLFIVNRIDYPVSTLTDTVSLLSCKFFVARRPRVSCERLNAEDDLL